MQQLMPEVSGLKSAVALFSALSSYKQLFARTRQLSGMARQATRFLFDSLLWKR